MFYPNVGGRVVLLYKKCLKSMGLGSPHCVRRVSGRVCLWPVLPYRVSAGVGVFDFVLCWFRFGGAVGTVGSHSTCVGEAEVAIATVRLLTKALEQGPSRSMRGDG